MKFDLISPFKAPPWSPGGQILKSASHMVCHAHLMSNTKFGKIQMNMIGAVDFKLKNAWNHYVFYTEHGNFSDDDSCIAHGDRVPTAKWLLPPVLWNGHFIEICWLYYQCSLIMTEWMKYNNSYFNNQF